MCTVSIIIPLYNKEIYIWETLNSVSNQTLQDWECLIINDTSTDRSPEIAKEFLKDSRFRMFNNERKGASAARNLGIQRSNGKYLQFLDADDIISHRKLQLQVEQLEQSSQNSIATCAWGRFTEISEGEVYSGLKSYANFDCVDSFLNSLKNSKGYFPVHAYLIKKEIVFQAGPWNENLTLNDDGEFMMRVIVQVKKIIFTQNAIAWYRSSDGNNLSSFKNKEAVEKAIYSWMLIEANLKLRYGKKANNFIEWSKGRFLYNLKNSFPELIDEHLIFFSNQLKEEIHKQKLFTQIKNEIKKFGKNK